MVRRGRTDHVSLHNSTLNSQVPLNLPSAHQDAEGIIQLSRKRARKKQISSFTRDLLQRRQRLDMLRRCIITSSFGAGHTVRALSTRASEVLSGLSINSTTELSGVYDGQWRGSGDVQESVCPTTGEVLARVRTASPSEVQETLAKTREAYVQFRSEW